MTENTNIEKNWIIETNNRYHKVVDVVISLATASLVLPIVLFRQFMGLDSKINIMKCIDYTIWISWSSLGISIFMGCSFFYLSAKLVKRAYGQRTLFGEKNLERLLDISFWCMVACFLVGIIFFIIFFVLYEGTC